MTSRNPRYLYSLLSVFVISLLSTSCYTYETLEFDINIPEQAESSIVLASDGTLITTLVAPENRTSARRLEEIPEIARNAVIAIEDERFYKHDGFDLKGILRAARSNLEAGGISQGGSTITQQYVKLAIIENVEQTASRKLEELWYATRLEDEYGKDFILLQYLNTVYFGHGAYGIKAAAQTYFNKDINENNGMWVTTDTIDMIKLINKLLSQNDLLIEKGQLGRDAVIELFSEEKIISQFESLYSELLNK